MPGASWYDESPPRRIVVMRALPGLGDMLCVVPALRALRAALPQARIDLIGLPTTLEFVQRFSYYVDRLIEFPGFPGLPERTPAIRQLPAFLADMHHKNYDLALQMHGNGTTSNTFTLLLGAHVTAGFYPPSRHCPDPEWFLPYPSSESEVRRHLRLIEFLGVPLKGEDLEFPLGECDWESLKGTRAAYDLVPGEYICVHAGATLPSRRWSPTNFAAVAGALASRGYQIVLTGIKAEAEITRAVAQAMRYPVIDLTGQTGLGALALLLSRARLVICNDTGVSHLAAAVRTPSVVVFVGSDRERWAPLDHQRHRPVGRLPQWVLREHRSKAPERRFLPDTTPFPFVDLGLQSEMATPTRVLEEAERLLDHIPKKRKAEWLD